MSTQPYRQWQCITCGEIYDEALGLPESGIAAGTRFEDIPATWICPNCGSGKADYTVIPDAQ